MASSSHDEPALSCEAIDWDLWLQNDHAESFEENYFHPDFESPVWHTGINKPPGDPRPEGIFQDVLTTDCLDLDTLSSNIQSVETSGANFDWEVLLSQEDTDLDLLKGTSPPETNPASSATYSLSSQLAPAPKMQNPSTPAISKSLSCDWPTCTRTFSTKSAYNQHYKNHTRPFKCPTCGARRATKCHLERHVNERHHATEKFYCPVSGCMRARKHFPRRDNFRRHLRQVHCLVGGGRDI